MIIKEGNINIRDMITINLKKYIEKRYKWFYKEARQKKYEYFKENIAGVFDWEENKILLIHSEFSKEIAQKRKIPIEKQVCYTLSHEIMHKILYDQFNWKVTAQFDNIAPKLKDYGVW